MAPLTRLAATLVATVGAAFLAGASAPAPSPTASDEPVRVMFLGDSITGGPGCWRAELWTRLSDDGYLVDAVGPFTRDDCGGVTDAAGEMWDPDNAGYGGITTYGVTSKIVDRGLLTKNSPDLIVMLLGTNDVRGGSTADEVLAQYTFLLGLFRDYIPDVSVVIGTLPPIGPGDCADCQAVLDELNPRIPGWAAGASTAASPVTAAVLHTDIDAIADTVDELHPNASGNAKIAAAWVEPVESALDEIAARHGAPTGLPPAVWIGLAAAVGISAAISVFRPRTQPKRAASGGREVAEP